MAFQRRARILTLALGSLAVSACGVVARSDSVLLGSYPLGVTKGGAVPASRAPLPEPLAPTADPQGNAPASSPGALRFLAALDRAAQHQERGAAELRQGNPDGAELEFHQALGLLLDPGADALQRASYRMSRAPLQPEPPLWQDRPARVAPEEAGDPTAEDGDPLPPGPALITPEDVQAIEKLPQGDVPPHQVDPQQFSVPVVLNDQVRTFLHYFANRKYDLITRAFERASRYLPIMRPIFREKGVPEDLLNLAFIESAFNPRAHSRARATGIWQFIESTGRRFGMRSGVWVDQRRDPELSTRGAAEYLKTLYGMFESWPLALAAYNAGEGKIQQAIARQKTTDFWRLRLPKETQLFVPAFMAMTIIAKDPARYGFAPLPEQAPETDTVVVNESVDLRALARAAQTTPEILRDLNPALVRGATPPGPFSLRVPAGTAEGFQERLAQIPRSKRSLTAQHRVRKGETWASIARRHRMPASALLELNGRSTTGPLKVGSTILVPGREATLAEAPGPAGPEGAAATPPAPTRRYTVKRGDTLDKIAKAHGVRVEDLVAWNGLKGRQPLKPGKVLVIHAGQAEARSAGVPAARGAAKPRQIRYTVKPGDTLRDIAQAHGVRPEELRRWNGLTGRRQNQLQPGQELQILLPEAS